jgi:hypothetical protein
VISTAAAVGMNLSRHVYCGRARCMSSGLYGCCTAARFAALSGSQWQLLHTQPATGFAALHIISGVSVTLQWVFSAAG